MQKRVSRKDRRREQRFKRRATESATEIRAAQRARIRRWASTAAGTFAAIVGLAASAGSFLPRLSVEPQFTWDQRAPLTTQFLVRNAGFLPLRDVRRDCVFLSINDGDVVASKDTCHDCFNNLTTLTKLEPITDALPLDSGISTNCNFFGYAREDASGTYEATQADRIDLVLAVHYRPVLLPWRRTRLFRFVTSIDSDRNVHWIAKPIDKKLAERIEQMQDAPLTRFPAGWRFAIKKPQPEKPPSVND